MTDAPQSNARHLTNPGSKRGHVKSIRVPRNQDSALQAFTLPRDVVWRVTCLFKNRDGAAHSRLRRVAIACCIKRDGRAVDVIGFLTLGGLFTAHITGNLVVLAAHFVTGRFSEAGPLFAIPLSQACR